MRSACQVYAYLVRLTVWKPYATHPADHGLLNTYQWYQGCCKCSPNFHICNFKRISKGIGSTRDRQYRCCPVRLGAAHYDQARRLSVCFLSHCWASQWIWISYNSFLPPSTVEAGIIAPKWNLICVPLMWQACACLEQLCISCDLL